MKTKNILIITLILGGLISCASKMATIDTKDIEKLRVDYNRGKIETIDDLIAIYKDPFQPVKLVSPPCRPWPKLSTQTP